MLFFVVSNWYVPKFHPSIMFFLLNDLQQTTLVNYFISSEEKQKMKRDHLKKITILFSNSTQTLSTWVYDYGYSTYCKLCIEWHTAPSCGCASGFNRNISHHSRAHVRDGWRSSPLHLLSRWFWFAEFAQRRTAQTRGTRCRLWHPHLRSPPAPPHALHQNTLSVVFVESCGPPAPEGPWGWGWHSNPDFWTEQQVWLCVDPSETVSSVMNEEARFLWKLLLFVCSLGFHK